MRMYRQKEGVREEVGNRDALLNSMALGVEKGRRLRCREIFFLGYIRNTSIEIILFIQWTKFAMKIKSCTLDFLK